MTASTPSASERVAWVYLDESGTPDWDPSDTSPYFAFGSATFTPDRVLPFREYQQARAERREILNGFHAYNDSRNTRKEFFDLITDHPAQYEATFMTKGNAFDYVRTRPKIWMYKYTLYRHLQQVVPPLRARFDVVHVVAAHINMDAKQAAVRHALDDVCSQLGGSKDVRGHIWKSATSAGLQIADYALWAIQRHLLRGDCVEYVQAVQPTLTNIHYPWGEAK